MENAATDRERDQGRERHTGRERETHGERERVNSILLNYKDQLQKKFHILLT